jgi:hypothetical protein
VGFKGRINMGEVRREKTRMIWHAENMNGMRILRRVLDLKFKGRRHGIA